MNGMHKGGRGAENRAGEDPGSYVLEIYSEERSRPQTGPRRIKRKKNERKNAAWI